MKMNERDTKALNWVRVHCQPLFDDWVWPSGYTHTEEESVKIARMCQALDREPSDLVSSELFDALVNKVIELEERLDRADLK